VKPWFAPIPETRVELAPAMLTPREASTRACLFAAALLAVAAASLLPPMVGMKVKAASFLPPLALLPSVAILWAWASWRHRPRARAAAELVLAPLLLSLPVLVFTYASMHSSLPLQDSRLEAWDSAIGFRALDFLAWLNGHPAFANLLALSYGSFFPQMIAVPLLLTLTGRIERAYAMALCVLLLGVIGASVCHFFPAVGVYAHHGIRPGAYPHIFQNLGYFHVQLEAVRGDPTFVLDVAHAQGIVAFPSGHAAIAMLCAWAMWDVKWARWPFLALNACMFVSALPQGAHYLVDLIAGAAMAGVAILVATAVPDRLTAIKHPYSRLKSGIPQFQRP
jgi:membrane-associated phospholipid phosphatase